MVWNTQLPGATGNNQIRLPLLRSGRYRFFADWQDGEARVEHLAGQVLQGEFAGAESFDQPVDRDTSSAVNLSGMFRGATPFTQAAARPARVATDAGPGFPAGPQGAR